MINTDKYTYVYLRGTKPKMRGLFAASYAIELDLGTNTFNVKKNRYGETYPDANIPLQLLADFFKHPDGRYVVHELYQWEKP